VLVWVQTSPDTPMQAPSPEKIASVAAKDQGAEGRQSDGRGGRQSEKIRNLNFQPCKCAGLSSNEPWHSDAGPLPGENCLCGGQGPGCRGSAIFLSCLQIFGGSKLVFLDVTIFGQSNFKMRINIRHVLALVSWRQNFRPIKLTQNDVLS